MSDILDLLSLVDLNSTDIEEFFNPNHGPDGRFAPGRGGASAPAGLGRRKETAPTRDVSVEWPDRSGTGTSLLTSVRGRNPGKSTRPFETIAKAPVGRRVEVDGIRARGVYEITANNGDKLRMYDVAGGRGPKKTQMLNSLAYMHEIYPMSPPRSIVLANRRMANQAGFVSADAWTYLDPAYPHLFMNSKRTRLMGGRDSPPGVFMPSARKVAGTHYTLTHEYGHQYDVGNNRNSSVGLFNNQAVRKHLSRYGRTQPVEGYAEAFAEWHSSEGRTKNPAAIAYARENSWHGVSPALTSSGLEVVWPSLFLSYDDGSGGILSFQIDANDNFDPEDNEDVSFPYPPNNTPAIVENWDGEAKIYGAYTPPVATKEEADRAEKFVRDLWAELGLDYEEDSKV